MKDIKELKAIGNNPMAYRDILVAQAVLEYEIAKIDLELYKIKIKERNEEK